MRQDDQLALMGRYRSPGMVKAGELLLPADALRLASDREAAGVAVMGVSCWCYTQLGTRTTLTTGSMPRLEIDPAAFQTRRAVQNSIRQGRSSSR